MDNFTANNSDRNIHPQAYLQFVRLHHETELSPLQYSLVESIQKSTAPVVLHSQLHLGRIYLLVTPVYYPPVLLALIYMVRAIVDSTDCLELLQQRGCPGLQLYHSIHGVDVHLLALVASHASFGWPTDVLF